MTAASASAQVHKECCGWKPKMDHLTHTGSLVGIAPTGKRVTLSGISIYRLANGKLVETHNAANLLEVFQQIGSLPPRG